MSAGRLAMARYHPQTDKIAGLVNISNASTLSAKKTYRAHAQSAFDGWQKGLKRAFVTFT